MNSKEEIYVFPKLDCRIVYLRRSITEPVNRIKVSITGIGRKKYTDGKYYLFPLIYNRYIEESKEIAVTINKLREEIDLNMKLCKIDPTLKDGDGAIMYYELDENQESENDRLHKRYFV